MSKVTQPFDLYIAIMHIVMKQAVIDNTDATLTYSHNLCHFIKQFSYYIIIFNYNAYLVGFGSLFEGYNFVEFSIHADIKCVS